MYRNVITVLTHPRRLREKSVPFSPPEKMSDQEKSALNDLKDTFNVLSGYGLAAPQIGILKRAVVVNFKALGVSEDEAVLMINPKMKTYGEEQRYEEACYSVPHISSRVTRPSVCEVTYEDEQGQEKNVTLEGFPATCMQHELDHLDGVLYIDRVGRAWRSILMSKLRKKEKKKREAEVAAREEFEREHRELFATPQKKTGHSKKRKPKARKKRPNRSKKKR